jgi:hypothetical protein
MAPTAQRRRRDHRNAAVATSAEATAKAAQKPVVLPSVSAGPDASTGSGSGSTAFFDSSNLGADLPLALQTTRVVGGWVVGGRWWVGGGWVVHGGKCAVGCRW